MLKYTLRKLIALIPKILVISLVLFLALEALPGDALSRTMDPMQYNKLTDYQKELAREDLGLNDPAYVRYFRWLGDMLTGDFGYSTSSGSSIREMLATRLPQTVELALWAMVISTFLGVLMGFLCAVYKNSFLDHLLVSFGVLGSSIPEFFIGITLLVVFALNLGWFPTGGRVGELPRIMYMVLPVSTLTFIRTAGHVRFVRSSMLDVMEKDYIKTARSKGINEFIVNVKHVLRNAMIPVMTSLVLAVPTLVSGAMIIEQVYNYAGVGKMVLEAQTASDIPVVMTTTMITAVIALLCSTLVDLFTALLDPRVRLGD